jgi:hypothetical protein
VTDRPNFTELLLILIMSILAVAFTVGSVLYP